MCQQQSVAVQTVRLRQTCTALLESLMDVWTWQLKFCTDSPGRVQRSDQPNLPQGRCLCGTAMLLPMLGACVGLLALCLSEALIGQCLT
jgi:hypothetical protein